MTTPQPQGSGSAHKNATDTMNTTDQPKHAASASPSTDAKVRAVRAEMPVTQHVAYLNAGTNGPLSRAAYEAQERQMRLEFEEGRIGGKAWERLSGCSTGARARFADLLGCATQEVALTHNTTEGVNIALMGLDWHPGDEIITSRLEHTGGLYPIYLLRQRYGVRIRMTDIGNPDRDPVEELRSALTPRTRAVMLSHVSWATGRVLPVRALADLAHEVGALFVCDAAQSCGMIPTPVYDLGVDAYACSGQKWLCGPDGTGALFLRRDRLSEVQPTFLGYMGIRHGMSDEEGYFVPTEGAKRFEVATLSPAGLRGLEASLAWIADSLGWPWVYARIAALGQYCYDALARLDGVTLLTPRDQMAGLVHFTVDGMKPEDLAHRLEDERILIRYTPAPVACRVSTGFYNTEEEIDALVAAIRRVRAE